MCRSERAIKSGWKVKRRKLKIRKLKGALSNLRHLNIKEQDKKREEIVIDAWICTQEQLRVNTVKNRQSRLKNAKRRKTKTSVHLSLK